MTLIVYKNEDASWKILYDATTLANELLYVEISTQATQKNTISGDERNAAVIANPEYDI